MLHPEVTMILEATLRGLIPGVKSCLPEVSWGGGLDAGSSARHSLSPGTDTFSYDLDGTLSVASSIHATAQPNSMSFL